MFKLIDKSVDVRMDGQTHRWGGGGGTTRDNPSPEGAEGYSCDILLLTNDYFTHFFLCWFYDDWLVTFWDATACAVVLWRGSWNVSPGCTIHQSSFFVMGFWLAGERKEGVWWSGVIDYAILNFRYYMEARGELEFIRLLDYYTAQVS